MTPGEAAFIAYCNQRGMSGAVEPPHRDFNKDLTERQKEMWEEIADAVINQHILDSDGDCRYEEWQKLKADKA